MSNINEKISKDNNQSEILKYKEQEKANEDDKSFGAFESKILNSDAIGNSDKKSSLTTENQGWIHDSVNEEPEKEESTEKIRIKNRRLILGLIYGGMFIICLITVILIKMRYDQIMQEREEEQNDIKMVVRTDVSAGPYNEIAGYEDGFYTKDVYGADGKFVFREKYLYITEKADAEKTDINDESGNNDGEEYDSIIETVFDSQGRLSKEIYASGTVSEYFYEEGFPSYTKIESKYSDGANSVEKMDGYYHTINWDRYEKNGEHLNAQNDWNRNRVITYYGSDGKIIDIEYEYDRCREDWIFSGHGKPIGLFFWFDEQSDWVEVYLRGDGYVTTETQSDGTIVKKLIDSELTYILTEKPNGNIKKEIIDKKGLCRYTIETWNRENMILITKYDKEGYIDEWAVSIRKCVFKYDTVPLEHTKGYVSFNEDDNCLEYVLYDASIDETEMEDKIIKKYFTFGRTETIQMVDGNIVMNDVDVSECFNYTDNYREMFPGNEEYDIEKIFSFYED